MLNILLNAHNDETDVISMLEGHELFLEKNTGITNDPKLDHFVFNPQGVLSNNRHFIASTQMEAQPNGDATTEGQALQVIGYCYAYMATGRQEYLDGAKKCFDAYIDYFYDGQPIPDSPQRYICNWLVNGKEPVVANWPVNFEAPTGSGFLGEYVNYTNGLGKITHGAPLWGEYLDKATFAFIGALGWKSIVADVYALLPDGSTDWNNKGQQFDVEWLINLNGDKVDWHGEVLSRNHPQADYGTIQLKNRGVQGSLKTNWGNAQPVEHGGYLIGRNEPWHNRPLRVPVGVGGKFDQLGNAADAEEWFADAAFLLYKITGEAKYWMVWQCVVITCLEYADIDSRDRFFRQEVGSDTPFTDGISYDFTYPSTAKAAFVRDENGYIDVTLTEAAQHSMEQQTVWFKTDQGSKIRTTFCGKDNFNGKLNPSVTIRIGKDLETGTTKYTEWSSVLNAPADLNVRTYDVPISSFVQSKKPDGTEFVVADQRTLAAYGQTSFTTGFENNVVDTRSAIVAKINIPNDDSGCILGFWLTATNKLDPQAIYLRTNTTFNINVTDDGGWKWHWSIPNTGGAWARADLGKSRLIANSYQPNGSPPPGPPNYSGVTQVDVSTPTSVPGAEFSWYVFDQIPAFYRGNNEYVMLYNLTTRGDNAFEYKMGDCTVIDYVDNDLFCTPGVIPFSNIYTTGSNQFDGWHGMPYPGYQYPFIWCHDNANKERLENMSKFLIESQRWYTQRFGIVGPGASAYVWNRWDNYKYGKPDTWTMYHWGDGTAWSGYQPRAYMGAARAWYELIVEGRDVPQDLIEYTENWTSYLYQFMIDSGGVSPTDFPMTTIPAPNPNDFTGHMCGLWLAGACLSALAGSKTFGLESLIEMLAKELNEHYEITPIPNHVMNGSWSPALRLDTGSGKENNGMFFGFWSGEILRGLGLYLLYKRLKPLDNMYEEML